MGLLKDKIEDQAPQNDATVEAQDVAADVVDDLPDFEINPDYVEEAKAEMRPLAPVAPIAEAATPAAAPVTMASAAAQASTSLAAAGFGGMKQDWRVFPTLTLDKGRFKSNDEDIEMDAEFMIRIHSSKELYKYNNTLQGNRISKKDEQRFVTSYDKITEKVSERPLADVLAEWAADGYEYDESEGLEVNCMVESGEYEGEFFVLNIPSTSLAKLNRITLTEQAKGRLPNEYLIKVSIGKSFMVNGFDVTPWSFKLVK
jgi:hypothetical protein